MNQTTSRKISFFAALSICFTSIVGIGIFLKNASVGKNVEGNGISWLMTWIISGILAILLAYHFGRISRIESKKGLTGLSAWTNEIADKKNNWFKKIVSVNYGFFYNPILTLCLSFFCTEFLIDFFKITIDKNIHVDIWIYVLISLSLNIFFILNNYFSVKFSGHISIVTSIIKFIPLLMVIFIGLIFANSHNLDSTTTNGFKENISFSKAIQGIMLSIPSVFFAFDSFVGVGAWSKDIKGGEKTVPKVIITAMILVTIIYCLVCLSSIFHFNPNKDGEGTTILNVLIDSLPINVKKGITIFISLTIFISAFGTSNSICGTSMNEFKNLILHKKTIFSNLLSIKFGIKKASLFLALILTGFWSLIIFIPSIIINSDAIIDGFSNIVVIFAFMIYSYLIFLFWRKEKKEFKNKTLNSIMVWITIVGVSVIVFLNVFYVFLNGIEDWDKSSTWGLLLTGKNYSSIQNLDVLIFYIAFSFVFFSFPFINYWIVQKQRKVI